MSKKYYFLAGLPRSGNTLLSQILKQNLNIYTSTINPLCEYIWTTHQNFINFESSIVNPNKNRSINLISKMTENYYYDVKQDVVVDTEKLWGTPGNLELIKKYIDPNPKIIFTTRPIIQVLASMINIEKDVLLKDMFTLRYSYDESISENDNICEFLMHPFTPFSKIFTTFMSIDDPINKDVFHIVKYEDLVSKPEKTLTDIYRFLDLPNFIHDFNNIPEYNINQDTLAKLPSNLHKVRKTISKSDLVVENILSERIIEKYKNFRYF